jgi:hypothetical protein
MEDLSMTFDNYILSKQMGVRSNKLFGKDDETPNTPRP